MILIYMASSANKKNKSEEKSNRMRLRGRVKKSEELTLRRRQ